MKKTACYLFMFTLIACTGRKQKSAESIVEKDTAVVSLKTIEGIAAYFFQKRFSEIEKDTALKGKYKIKKGPVEEEGVEWDSYDFVRNDKVVFTVENNWESKNKVHRITFLNSEISTDAGLSANSKFHEVKKQIDTLRTLNDPDGFFSFSDKKLPCMYYLFEDPNNEYLSKAAAGGRGLPDSLSMYAIVLLDCPTNR